MNKTKSGVGDDEILEGLVPATYFRVDCCIPYSFIELIGGVPHELSQYWSWFE